MKKKLVISAAVILLLLIFVYGWLQWRQYQSFQNSIHQNASLVFKINLDGIFKSVSADFLSNPRYYLKQGQHKQQKPDRGFAVPANVLIYNIRSKSPQTYFCTLSVTDTADLKFYLQTVFDIFRLEKRGDGSTVGTSKDPRLTVAYNSERLAIAYSYKKENVRDILDELLDGKHFLQDTATLIRKLKKERAHLAWQDGKHSGSGDFSDGALVLNGTFPIPGLLIPDQPQHRNNFAKDAALKLWFNAGFRSKADEKTGTAISGIAPLQLKGFTLHPDSLLKYYHGYADLELNQFAYQQDTSIAYEFNDDFEKVAKTVIKDVQVPDARISFDVDQAPLMKYLERQQILVGDKINKEVFPLLKVFSKNNAQVWQLSTKADSQGTERKIASPYFFYASADFEKIRKHQYPLLNRYIHPFSDLEIKASKIDPVTAKLDLKISFLMKNINAFSQLIKY